MYLGEIVETGPVEAIYAHALHPYTQALLSAVPAGEPGKTRARIILEGDPPSPLQPSSSAARASSNASSRHAAAFQGDTIRLREAGPGHLVRCARLEVPAGAVRRPRSAAAWA